MLEKLAHGAHPFPDCRDFEKGNAVNRICVISLVPLLVAICWKFP